MSEFPDIETLIEEQAIERRVREMAAQISYDCAGKELLLVSILKGAAHFAADLARSLTVSARMEFVRVSSYGNGTTPSRTLTLQKDIDVDVQGRQVLLVDGIIDTGATLDFLLSRFRERGPAGLKAAVLLDKRSRRTVAVPLDYIGFPIPDRFVVGYGMDYREQYRNLPYIAMLRQE